MDILCYGLPHSLALWKNELLQKFGRSGSQPMCSIIRQDLQGIGHVHRHCVQSFLCNMANLSIHHVVLPQSRIPPFLSFSSKLEFHLFCEDFGIFQNLPYYNHEWSNTRKCVIASTPEVAATAVSVRQDQATNLFRQKLVALHDPELLQSLLFFIAELPDLCRKNELAT